MPWTVFRYLICYAFLTLYGNVSAQLSGNYAIPGGYPSVAAAIADLNSQGVAAAGAVFNIMAGHTEVFPSGISGRIRRSGTATGPIIFQKSGAGPNPILIAGEGTFSSGDGIIVLVGASHIVIDGIDVQENPANLTAIQQMEWGYAMVKNTSVVPSTGCNYNIIRNCTVTLNRSNINTVGIYAGTHGPGTTVASEISSPTQTNSNNKIYSNTIKTAYSGIILKGYNYALPGTQPIHDQNNEIGGTSAGAGNQILNYGGSSAVSYGIGGFYQTGINIVNNLVRDSSDIFGNSSAGIIHGIHLGVMKESSGTISNNTISLTIGNNASAVYGLYAGMTGNTTDNYNTSITGNIFEGWKCNGGSGEMNFIFHSGNNNTVNISGNQFVNNVLNTTGRITFISNQSQYNAIARVTVSANFINNNSRTGAGSTIGYSNYSLGYTRTGARELISDNTISNCTLPGASDFIGIYAINSLNEGMRQIITGNLITNITFGTGAFTGIANNYGATDTVANNVVSNIECTGGITGISVHSGNFSSGKLVSDNLVFNLKGSRSVVGISVSSYHKTTICRNRIYNIESIGSASNSRVIGLVAGEGNIPFYTVFNNYISDLRAPNSPNGSGVTGLSITAPPANDHSYNIAYNTIYLDASSSSPDFGSTCIEAGVNIKLMIRNNIFVNKSVSGSNGITAAFRIFENGAFFSYHQKSNRNLFYAGNPGPRNLIFHYGAIQDQTLAAFQNRYPPRESNSVTEFPPFINTSTRPYDLRISPSVPTLVNGRGWPLIDTVILGIAVPAITQDFDQEARNAITPDIGADEFNGAMPVTFLYFTGERRQGKNSLLWATATEINNKGFEIQRSADGSIFSNIGFVFSKGIAGTANVPITYGFDDAAFQTGTSYYRLKQVDLDGRAAYSKTVMILDKNTPAAVQIVGVTPNPGKNALLLSVSSPGDQKTLLQVLSSQGGRLIERMISLGKGENHLSLDISALPRGVYYIRVSGSIIPFIKAD